MKKAEKHEKHKGKIELTGDDATDENIEDAKSKAVKNIMPTMLRKRVTFIETVDESGDITVETKVHDSFNRLSHDHMSDIQSEFDEPEITRTRNDEILLTEELDVEIL